jgi:ABC-type phosphate transport system substrate-binding protein
LGTFASIDDLFASLGRIDDILNPPPVLCVAGSGTILEADLGLASDWETDFEAQLRVNVDVDAIGSVGGVNKAASGGCVHVLAMSEALTENQQQQLTNAGIQVECAAEIGYDIIAFVTDKDNTLSALDDDFMTRILTGQATNWNEVRAQNNQTIYIHARTDSGTTDHVLRTFGWPQGEAFLPPNANYIRCNSNIDCLNKTLATPGSLYWVSLSWMRTQPEDYLRVLPILTGDEAPIDPLHDADYDIRDYPRQLSRPLYMYILKNSRITPETEQLAKDFLVYVRGVGGQKLLEDHYFAAYFNRLQGVKVEFPEGFAELSNTPRQLCLSGDI